MATRNYAVQWWYPYGLDYPRLVDKLIAEEDENKHSVFRPEFTIRNIQLPLEGRLDLITGF